MHVGAPPQAAHRLVPVAGDPGRDEGAAPLLQALLTQTAALLGAVAGSVSLLEATRERYGKVAARGTACCLGQTFPVDEGVTGEVVARRGPVLLRRYSDVPRGHLSSSDPVGAGAVAAAPLWWRGDVIGAAVAFAGPGAPFSARQVDELEVLTAVAAAGIVAAGAGSRFLTHLPRGATTTEDHPGPAASPLSAREHEVAALLTLGLSDRQVASRLVISQKTVEKHVGAVLRKTRTTSRTGAVVRALQEGWVAWPAGGRAARDGGLPH